MVTLMNYFSTDGITPRTTWCAVYDPDSGEVVHVHEFIGNEIADDNEYAQGMRADIAMSYVRQHHSARMGLGVIQGEPGKLPKVGDRLEFDRKRKKLVTVRDVKSLAELVANVPGERSVQSKGQGSARRKTRKS